MAIPKEVLQELLKEYKNPEDLLGEHGILKQLTKELVESALGSELTDHLGYEKHQTSANETGNRRNGSSKKTLRTDQGDTRFQRQDIVHVCPRHDQPGEYRALEGDVRYRGLPAVYQLGNRWSS